MCRYSIDMSKDAWQSLIAWGSVISIIGLILLSREFVEGIEVPAWLGLIGLGIMTIDLIWRFVSWVCSKRAASREGRA